MIRIVPPEPANPEGPVSVGRAWLLVLAVLVYPAAVLAGTPCVERFTDEDTAATAAGVFTLVWLLLVAAVVVVRREKGDR
jgi:hypothetical protein